MILLDSRMNVRKFDRCGEISGLYPCRRLQGRRKPGTGVKLCGCLELMPRRMLGGRDRLTYGQLEKGGIAYARWPSIADALIRRAERSVTIKTGENPGR